MRLSRIQIALLMWLGTCACWLLGVFGFATFVPWTFDVMSVSEALVRCPGAPGAIDAAWPAVLCNHGRPSEWELGLISDNPIRYNLSLVQMLIGLVGFLLGARQMERFR